MKNSLLILIATGVLFSQSSCEKKAKEETLTVDLKGYVGDRELSFVNSFYADSMGKDFYFSALKFFIAHLQLVKTDNSLVEVSEVEFLDYADPLWKSFSVQAPAGDYKGIIFHVGLDPTQNATDPLSYSASHPLGAKAGMYWTWLKHVFVYLEGRADTSGQNFTGGSTGLVYHVGRDTCYREVVLNGPAFSIPEGASKKIDLNLDVLKVFYGETDTLNMYLQPGTQSEDSDLEVAIKFANQFSKTFSYSE